MKFLCFLIGSGIGAATAWYFTKQHYSAKCEKEIEEFKQYVRNDILEADNLERHDKVVAARAVNEFIVENDLDIPKVTVPGEEPDEKEETEKKYSKLVDENKYDEEVDDIDPIDEENDICDEDGELKPEHNRYVKFFEVKEEDADEYEINQGYEAIFYTWKKGSEELIYAGHSFVDISDVLDEYGNLLTDPVRNIGEVVYIVNVELEHLYCITVARP
jgi:hypothetical protein